MKKFLYIFYIGILLVVASCSPSSPSGYSRYGVFPETDEVTVGETALDSVYFRYPYRMEIGNGLAVLLDLHNDSHYLYAFTYPDWQPVAPFGKRGEDRKSYYRQTEYDCVRRTRSGCWMQIGCKSRAGQSMWRTGKSHVSKPFLWTNGCYVHLISVRLPTVFWLTIIQVNTVSMKSG